MNHEPEHEDVSIICFFWRYLTLSLNIFYFYLMLPTLHLVHREYTNLNKLYKYYLNPGDVVLPKFFVYWRK